MQLYDPRVIGLLQQKGGVGKTSLAINLADYFARAGERVLLIDADPQGSALAWSSLRQEKPRFPVIGMAKPTLHRELGELAGDYDRVIIDGSPRVNELTRSAIMASDLVLIPVQPSPMDVWAGQDTVELVKEAMTFRPAIQAAFVVNRKISNTVIGRAVRKAFAEQPFPLLNAAICQRVIFPETAGAGMSVFDAEPDGKAAHEIKRLAKLITKQQRRKAA